MLSERSNPRATNRQQMTAFDHNTIPSLFTPKFFLPSPPKATSISSSSESDNIAMSPTSVLETTRPFSPINIGTNDIPYFLPKKSTTDQSKHHHHHHPIGLGLVDILRDENTDTTKKTPNAERTNAMLVTSTKHRIQIHPMQPYSPVEFGIKNKRSQLASLDADMLPFSPRHGTTCLSPRDMELSEDYTCVIARGPNPKTTHIFDNLVIESRDGFLMDLTSSGSGDFLRFCHACKKELLPGKDVFMYRGERTFCSSECRYQEMSFDDGMEDY